MSIDFDVYVAHSDGADVGNAANRVDGLRWNDNDTLLERWVRSKWEYCAHVSEPVRVETEDLPEAVIAASVGVSAVLNVTVEGSSAVGARYALRFAKHLADATGGVVFDPQQDAVVWPRASRRRLPPRPSQLIDVVGFDWYVRRADSGPDLPLRVLDVLRTHFPEALPRRYGAFEPMQGTFDAGAADRFAREWRNEASLFFWSARKPCFGGLTSGLGAQGPRPPEQPIGHIALTIDAAVFASDDWTTSLIACFTRMAAATDAFFASADVDHNLRASGNRIGYGPEAISNPGPYVRETWMGLPVGDIWLAWFGPSYRSLVRPDSAARMEERDGGLLHCTRASATERAVGRERTRLEIATERSLGAVIDDEYLLRATGDPLRGGERERALRVPEGL